MVGGIGFGDQVAAVQAIPGGLEQHAVCDLADAGSMKRMAPLTDGDRNSIIGGTDTGDVHDGLVIVADVPFLMIGLCGRRAVDCDVKVYGVFIGCGIKADGQNADRTAIAGTAELDSVRGKQAVLIGQGAGEIAVDLPGPAVDERPAVEGCAVVLSRGIKTVRRGFVPLDGHTKAVRGAVGVDARRPA